MKTAFITGGSSGLGLEMAKYLAAREYHPVIMARTKVNVESAVQSIKKVGPRADGFVGDITDSDALKNISQNLKEKFGKIDFLILNAGVVHVKLLTDYESPEEMKKDVEINLCGTMLTAYYLVPLLKPGSKVVIISSALGLLGTAGYSSYCAAKAGLINFGESLRRELLYKNISVYVACPADIETPQYENEHKDMPQWMIESSSGRPSVLSAETAAARILKKCSGKRFLIFSDLGIHAMFLLSKLFPARLMNYILDRMIPRPKRD